MKDIAIYRLQRIDAALARLVQSLDRLESVTAQVEVGQGASSGGSPGGSHDELAAMQRDYAALKAAATKVSDQLEQTLTKLEAEKMSASSA